MGNKFLGPLLILTGAFLIVVACLKQGFAPRSPLFPNFLLGLGVGAQGIAYLFHGAGSSAAGASRRKRIALVFIVFYCGVVIWMLARLSGLSG